MVVVVDVVVGEVVAGTDVEVVEVVVVEVVVVEVGEVVVDVVVVLEVVGGFRPSSALATDAKPWSDPGGIANATTSRTATAPRGDRM